MHIPSDPAADPGPQRTILVVDDEEVVRLLIARALTDAGYRVLEATHGAEAIGVLELRAADIDLVICDLVMPVVSGREVGRWLAAHWPGLPVLFVSGYPRAYLESHELYDPEIALLRKPFLPSRLLEAVDDALRPAKI